MYLFSAASFNYYLLNYYLKYMPGNIYTNSIVSSLAETFAHYAAGWLVLKIGSIHVLTGTNAMAAAAATVLWICAAFSWLSVVPFSVIAAKFGTGGAFAALYMSTL